MIKYAAVARIVWAIFKDFGLTKGSGWSKLAIPALPKLLGQLIVASRKIKIDATKAKKKEFYLAQRLVSGNAY